MSKHRFTCLEKRNSEKLTLKNCYSINFGFWAEKTWTFSKTVKPDFQNCSPRVQGNKFRSFSETKKNCMKIFGLWTGRSDFWWKILLRVAKGAFRMSSATLWEKDNESKLYFLWLVYDSECYSSIWQES